MSYFFYVIAACARGIAELVGRPFRSQPPTEWYLDNPAEWRDIDWPQGGARKDGAK